MVEGPVEACKQDWGAGNKDALKLAVTTAWHGSTWQLQMNSLQSEAKQSKADLHCRLLPCCTFAGGDPVQGEGGFLRSTTAATTPRRQVLGMQLPGPPP